MKRVRKRVLAAAGIAVLMMLPAACSGSSLDPDRDKREGPIRIGLIWPTSGVLEMVGTEFRRGWDLYLEEHGNKLGGQEIQVTAVDEGDGRQTAQDGVKKLLEQEKAEVIVGTVSTDALMVLHPAATAAKVPYLGTGALAAELPDMAYGWHIAFRLSDPGAALADYVRTAVDGPVWAIGPDFVGGYGFVNGFVGPFTQAGGKLANPDGKPTWVPYPATTNFVPYLNQVLASDAKAVFAFFGGSMAIGFLKQYDQVVQGRLPLYVIGVTIEGNALLGAVGEAADGVYSSLNYAADLDNAANRAFVTAYQAKYNEAPSNSVMQGWDAALVLDLAIAAAGPNPTSETINAAIGSLGAIPSPRGDWKFGPDHAPIQPWYLRQVRTDGRGRANVVVQTLAVIGGEKG